MVFKNNTCAWVFPIDFLQFLLYYVNMIKKENALFIFKAKDIPGDHRCIMGDVTATLLSLGTPEQVETYCRKLIDQVGKGGGFILSSGCTVPYNAKIENLKGMINTGKNYQLSSYR